MEAAHRLGYAAFPLLVLVLVVPFLRAHSHFKADAAVAHLLAPAGSGAESGGYVSDRTGVEASP